MYHKYREAAVGSITVQPPAPVSPVPPTCRTLRPRPSMAASAPSPESRHVDGLQAWVGSPDVAPGHSPPSAPAPHPDLGRPLSAPPPTAERAVGTDVGQPLQTHLLLTRACKGTRGPRCISAAWQVWRCPAGSPVFVERMRTGTSLLLRISRAVVEPRVFGGKREIVHTEGTSRFRRMSFFRPRVQDVF